MPTKTKKFRSFVFQLGYVESTTVSCFLLTHNQGFDTIQEALLDLARVFQEGDRNSYRPAPKKCCVAAREKPGGNDEEYCAKCGAPLHEETTPPGQLFAQYFQMELHETGEMYETLEDNGWSQQFDDFDWEGRTEIHNMECMLTEAKDWVRGRPRNDGTLFKDDADWLKYHMSYPEKISKDRLLK